MANQWIKLYTEILHDRKFRKMTERQQLVCLKLFLLAGQEDQGGQLPSLEDISLELYMPNQKQLRADLDRLTDLGILSFDGETWIVINFQKRQESALTGYERVKRYRENRKVINDNTMITDDNADDNAVSVINDTKMITVDKDIDIEEEIEEDKELKRESVNTSSLSEPAPAPAPKPSKHRYGHYNHVLLTDDEYAKLSDKYPSGAGAMIQKLDNYLENNRKKHYDNHYLTILTWARKDAETAPKPEPGKRLSFAEIVQLQDQGVLP